MKSRWFYWAPTAQTYFEAGTPWIFFYFCAAQGRICNTNMVLFSVNTLLFCTFRVDRCHPARTFTSLFEQMYCMQMRRLLMCGREDVCILQQRLQPGENCNLTSFTVALILRRLLFDMFVTLCCFFLFDLFLYLHLFYYFVSKLLVTVAVPVSLFCALPWRSGKPLT